MVILAVFKLRLDSYNMTGLFDHLKLLFEQQLYTNVVSLVSINVWVVNKLTLDFDVDRM